MTFLDASRAAAECEEKEREAVRQRELERARQLAETQARVARLFKRFAGGLAMGLCLAVALTIWAFMQQQEAIRQEAAANEQREIAQNRETEARFLETAAKQQRRIAEANAADADRERKTALQAQKQAADALAVVEAQKAKSEAAEEARRKQFYANDMRLAPFVWRDDRTPAEQGRDREIRFARL
jgi:hypothetical protein